MTTTSTMITEALTVCHRYWSLDHHLRHDDCEAETIESSFDALDGGLFDAEFSAAVEQMKSTIHPHGGYVVGSCALCGDHRQARREVRKHAKRLTTL